MLLEKLVSAAERDRVAPYQMATLLLLLLLTRGLWLSSRHGVVIQMYRNTLYFLELLFAP